MQYNHNLIEEKWREMWKRTNAYRTGEDASKEKFYVLDMFPYPSGEGLHVGHPKGYIATDVIARKKMMEGKNVLHPMGMDAFGLPAENHALKHKIHPSVAVAQNIERFKGQLEQFGCTYDWEREISTTDPAFYKWTQWAFVQMFKKGLAYESFEPINWCPSCKTGLANEDLEDGRCERCGSVIEKKPLRQWVLKITDYADRLLDDLDTLNWPEAIKEAQRNWIGRSEGAEIDFALKNLEEKITVFTTRPETVFGVTYVVLSPEHPLVESLKDRIANYEAVSRYIESAGKKTDIERTGAKEKTGVALEGISAINPATNEPVPVWVADYVLADYGTGAVMAVPAHDERDFEFAAKYELPIKQVIAPVFRSFEGGDAIKSNSPFTERNAVMCIVKHWEKDEFLCLQWNEFPEIRSFISGGIEAGENAEEAGRREIHEESGYKNANFVRQIGGTAYSEFYHQVKEKNIRARFTYLYFELENGEQDEVDDNEKRIHTISWKKRSDVFDFLSLIEKKTIWSQFITSENPYTGPGYLVNSEDCNNLESEEARNIVAKKFGRSVVRYKLRDWVFSRQRYWGEPIPIVHCERCGAVAVREEELPVVLPEVESYEPSGTGESPLATIEEWVNTTCPGCGGPAKRETNTMPQWAGSSWYYLRYIDPNNDKALVDPEKERYWSPVDVYVGGAEHATRHLIYARFWHKFLYDIGTVSYNEPFKRYTNLGLILAEDGRKMSKRWGNVINPDDIISRYGADAFRLYEMFIGPFIQAASFKESGVAAARSFLNRVMQLAEKISDEKDEAKTVSLLHKTVKKVGDDIEEFKFNTAVSSLMILANAYGEAGRVNRKAYGILLKLIAPFAPHVAEEMWHEYNFAQSAEDSIFSGSWPKYDEALLVDERATIAVQVNGKLRDTFEIASDSDDETVKQEALSRPNVAKWLEGADVKKIIVVKNKLVSIVI